jgi:hypothetical protein
LGLWQTYVPHELTAEELAGADWPTWLRAEDAVMNEVKTAVSEKLPAADCTPANRYCPQSPIYPPKFAQNWNRSYILEPVGTPVGAVVLMHGLTDAPYSVRSVAEAYRARGWLAVAARPWHGAGRTDQGHHRPVARGDGARSARGAAPRAGRAVACCWLFERRRAGARLCAQRDDR